MKRLWLLFCMVVIGALCVLPASAASNYLYCAWGDTVSGDFDLIYIYSGDFKAGQKWYFDVSCATSNYFYNSAGAGVSVNSSQVYSSVSYAAGGASYSGAVLSYEGNGRFWVYFQQDMSSITLSLSASCVLSWAPSSNGGSGTWSGYTVRRSFTFPASVLRFSSSGPSLASYDAKLDTIIDLLQGSVSLPRNLGYGVYTYFDSTYYPKCFVPGGSDSLADNGAFIVKDGTKRVGFYADSSNGRFYSGFLPAGTYFVIGSTSEAGDFVPTGVSFEGVDAAKYTVSDVQYYRYNDACYWYCVVTLKDNIVYNCVYWLFDGTLNGMLYGGILAAPDDYVAGSALNPNQSQKTEELNDAGNQQAGQENQLWQNINSYKSDISFALDGWDDAAAGLSYVTNVFMLIWDNSPTQAIVLSLMLGIAMLSIGRGVSAAVRVSHNRRDKGD